MNVWLLRLDQPSGVSHSEAGGFKVSQLGAGYSMSLISTLRLSLSHCIIGMALVGGDLTAQEQEALLLSADSYSIDRDFFKLRGGRTIGATAGITIDRDGRSIWVFERCGGNDCVGSDAAPILQFDETGELVRSLGAGMFNRPHGIHIDADGNIWVTDTDGPDGNDPRRNDKGHQVFKMSPEGEVLLTLGKAGVAGDGHDEFNRPSAVLVAPSGDIFVADGHGGESNARIVKFSGDGTFVKTWGIKGTAPGEFGQPHALAMDSLGRLFVGDRENARIQIFNQNGDFLDQWSQFGNPSGIYIDRNDVLYVTDADTPGMEGIRIGSVTDGKVVAFIDDDVPDALNQEGVAVDAAGNIFGSLTRGMELRRYVKR